MPRPIDQLLFPDDLNYSADHEWVRQDGKIAVIGLNDYAQDQLGDIVFVELPEAGSTFSAGDVFATVESVKAVSECYIPVSGEILEMNRLLEDSPESVNRDPYGEGWFVKLRLSDKSELDALMTSAMYVDSLKGR